MKRYFPRYFVRHILWVLILLFPFCASFNLSLAAGIGSVLSLDGDGDEVRVGHAQSLVMTDALTIEAWIYPLGTGSGWGYTDDDGGIIVNKEGEYELGRFHDGSIQFAVANESPGWDWINSGYIVPEGTWAHLALTYSANAQIFQLFANGVLVFSTAGKGEIGDVYSTNNYFKIGGRREEAAQYFDGMIDEVRLWNIVRTEAEIQATMNASLQGNELGLAGYWNFDDGTANDLSTNRNHGDLHGNAAIVTSQTAKIFFSAINWVNVGDTFTLDLTVEDITDFAGWQLDIAFNPEVLKAVSVSEGSLLSKDGGSTFFQEGEIDNTGGEITGISGVLISKSGISGTGTLLSVTFEAKAAGEERLQLHNVKLGSANRSIIFYEIIINPIVVERSYDVNGDGMVNILDLTLVSQNFGQVNPQVDVNDDGTVDIFDLIAVAQDLATTPLAPSVEAWNRSGLNPEAIQNWIDMAHAANDGSLAFRVGIANLEHLLEAMRPDQTSLLANYPNPFNPETWIPYQLAHAADVTLTIYDTQGTLVRQLDLGYQHVGYYTDKTRAAYWNERNHVGESVGSGIYFYQLRAGDYSTTRKMVILK